VFLYCNNERKTSVTALTNSLLPHLLGALRRFPVAVLSSVALCVYANIWLVGNRGSTQLEWQTVLALSAAFLAAGAAHLFAEARRLSFASNYFLAWVAGLFAAALLYFDHLFKTSPLFLFAALAVLLMLSPYMPKRASQAALWLFNMRLALAIVLAIIVGLIFAGGVSAIVAGLDFLLGIKIEKSVYEHIWATAMTLVSPFYGLSLAPSDLDEEIDIGDHKGTLVERGVAMLVNVIMVPLVLIYALILHAYAAKIAIGGSLPKGEIGLIVSLFAAGGTATWLIGWPWREKGAALLRLFMRAWFWLLPIPVILLAIAIIRRVTDYGMTPDRYAIGGVAVWTAFVFLYLVLRRNAADMRVILGSMAVIFLVGSFGPQGAFGTTASSQLARLKVLMEASGYLKDGKLVSPLPNASGELKQQGYSMISTLGSVGGLDPVKEWLGEPQGLELDRWASIDDITNKLGVSYNNQSPDHVNFSTSAPMDLKFASAGRLIGPLNVGNYQEKFPNGVQIKDQSGVLGLTIDGQLTSIPVAKIIEKLKVDPTDEPPPIAISLDPTTKIVVSYFSGVGGENPKINFMTFWIQKQD
jgi:hypothetical protein